MKAFTIGGENEMKDKKVWTITFDAKIGVLCKEVKKSSEDFKLGY